MDRELKTSIKLVGNPVFAISYIDSGNKQVCWDISSFRPDFKNYLSSGEDYSAIVELGQENFNNKLIYFPVKVNVIIDGGLEIMFRNIR